MHPTTTIFCSLFVLGILLTGLAILQGGAVLRTAGGVAGLAGLSLLAHHERERLLDLAERLSGWMEAR